MLKTENKNLNQDSFLNKGHPTKQTLIGNSINIKGDLSSSEDLVIKGKFQGTIDAGTNDVFIAKEATVEADIQANNIILKGKAVGNITSAGKVFIGKEAYLMGNISASCVSIQDGAKVKGRINMTSNREKPLFPQMP
jgi:cytoskeletal protein CcmA (bactofilin family)